jgi:hypothetical protein
MRLRIFRSALGGAALLAATAMPAAAQEALSFGSWQTFTWIIQDGMGADPVDGDGFSFESAFQTRIRITDAGDAGDAFGVFVNGSPFGLTPSMTYAPVGAYTGDEAWADPQFSQLEFFLDPGRYTITLTVREDAGFGYGEGFIRADELTAGSVVPEPATFVLMATALAALPLIARRHRRRGAVG